MKSYSELLQHSDWDSRLEYLKLWDTPHLSPRHMSPSFYKSRKWLQVRDSIIRRDLGFDMGVANVFIYGNVYVHHINPLSEEDIINDSWKLYDPENLIAVSHDTHNAIHYKPKQEDKYVERRPDDTKLW